jgi:hypothetical protein
MRLWWSIISTRCNFLIHFSFSPIVLRWKEPTDICLIRKSISFLNTLPISKWKWTELEPAFLIMHSNRTEPKSTLLSRNKINPNRIRISKIPFDSLSHAKLIHFLWDFVKKVFSSDFLPENSWTVLKSWIFAKMYREFLKTLPKVSEFFAENQACSQFRGRRIPP